MDDQQQQRMRVYVDEMVDKGGNTWGPNEWPDLVHKHLVDLYKAPEVEILAEQHELHRLSLAAIKGGARTLWNGSGAG